MKRIFYLLLFVLIFKTATAIEFHVQQVPFSTGDKSYVESYLSINPISINYKKQTDGKLRSDMVVTIIFHQQEKIVKFDKYQLHTQSFDSISEILTQRASLLDIKRYYLADGDYQMDVEINDGAHTAEQKDMPLHIGFAADKIAISPIELLDTFYSTKDTLMKNFKKNGLVMMPYVLDYFPRNKNSISFYAEIYNPAKAGLTGKFLTQFMILKKENKKQVGNLASSMVQESAEIVPVINKFDITNITSGNYILRMEIRNRANELMASQEINFQRNKPADFKANSHTPLDSIDFTTMPYKNTFVDKFNREEISYRLKSIRPIADLNENRYITNLLKDPREEYLKGFYYNFWLQRNPESPLAAFTDYEKVLKMVNETFGTQMNYGFETDRGRVYLHYGAPNTINDEQNDPDALPYQVWDYYDLPDQKNVVFVFYTPDRSTNDYQIIHSTARGEHSDPAWAAKVQGSKTGSPNFDKSGYNRNYGGKLENTYGRKINDQSGVK